MTRRAIEHRPCAPHLFSALIACALPIALLYGGRLLAVYLEEKTIHATAPKDFFFKNQGLAFQRAAARAPDIMLLYGSSELIDPIPNRASDFFSSGSSGFEVCPVGNAGATALIIVAEAGRTGLQPARPESCDLVITKLVFQACRQPILLCRKLLVTGGQRHPFWRCS